MLRLFSAFMESAPQLIFQLYALIELQPAASADNLVAAAADQPAVRFNASWAAVSAALSTLSLGWGVAAYCHALRLARAEGRRDGRVPGWVGGLVQTVWRFCLLAARLMAMVLLCLALQRWALLIFCKYIHNIQYTVHVLCCNVLHTNSRGSRFI